MQIKCKNTSVLEGYYQIIKGFFGEVGIEVMSMLYMSLSKYHVQ